MTGTRAAKWLAIALLPLLGAADCSGFLLGIGSVGPYEPEVDELTMPAAMMEGARAEFTFAAHYHNGTTLQRSDDAGRTWQDLRYLGNGSNLLIESVDYGRDRGALFRVVLDPQPDAHVLIVGPYGPIPIVRLTAIEAEPADVTTNAGQSAQFAVQVRGDSLVYGWQRSDDGGTTWRNVAGRDATLRLDAVQAGDDGALWRVRVVGSNGEATSRAARLHVSAVAPVVFSDERFADADWALELVQVGSGGTVTALQQPDLGHPGTWRALSIDLFAPSAQSPGAVHAMSWLRGAVHDPRADGAIASIDYREDQRRDAGDTAEHAQTGALIVRQAGHVYYAPTYDIASVAWSALEQLSLSSSSFTYFSGADPARPLDFSAAGAPIEFGVIRSVNAGAGQPGFRSTSGLDNWSVTLRR